MKITVNRNVILPPLQMLIGVVERRQTLPILSNVLIKLEKSQAIVTATDLEVEMAVTVGVSDGDGEEGRCTLPARKFVDICRALGDEAVLDMNVEGEKCVIKAGRSRFKLATLPADEFPNVGAVEGSLLFSAEETALASLFSATQFAMAQQDVRYYLNGMLLDLYPGEVRAVATDGHRLAVAKRELQVEIPDNQQFIVPRKAVMELTRLLVRENSKVAVYRSDKHLRLQTSDWVFTTKLVDGRFPEYQRVIPEGADKLVLIDREALRQALVRVSILTNEKYKSVRIVAERGVMRIQANNPEQEEAVEDVPASYDSEAVEIGFNVSYLLDVLSTVKTDNVEIRLSDPSSCCLIAGEGDDTCQYVIMPMRL